MRRTITAFVLSLGLMAAAIPSVAFSEELKVGAGAAASENIFKKIMQPLEASTGIKLALVENGPYEALLDLMDGKIEVAVAGLSMDDWMKMMEERGVEITDKAAYPQKVIGKDVIKVIVNKDVGVSQLSKDQLKGLLTGSVKNWKDVGGADKPVVVVFGNKIPGTQSVFQKMIMDGAEYAPDVLEATNAPDVKAKVMATAGAIGLAPKELVDATVGAPQIPEVARPITLLTKGAPSAGATKLIAFIEGEGQKFITK